MPDDVSVDTSVTTREAVREIVGDPIPIVRNKELARLDRFCRQFIEKSPFLCLGTAGADGHIDMSPRGDPAGFVKIIDDSTLLLPERQGNQRVDSMINITENPNVGLIFFLPGVEETLRIRGHATITRDSALLEPLAMNGKTPKLGLIIAIDQVFFQCAKALIRAKLWDPQTPIKKSEFPSSAEITQGRRPDMSVEEVQELQDKIGYRTRLY
jgi:PPOX class probable FMN-dependent enzyme